MPRTIKLRSERVNCHMEETIKEWLIRAMLCQISPLFVDVLTLNGLHGTVAPVWLRTMHTYN